MDVVIAPATPWGRGALAVVRLSGEGLGDVLPKLVRPFTAGEIPFQRPRRVHLVDGEGTYDDAVIVRGRAPHTVTGEETAEISCHGNPIIVERLLRAAAAVGVRLAEPGEFTRRSLENGRIDLLGAEAVLQVAEASSERGLAIARDGLDGRLALYLAELREKIVYCAADLEARLDYPADELAFLDDSALLGSLSSVAEGARSLAETFGVGRVWTRGARVALVGGVNAGKSSLFNALLGRPRALVHEQAGTTRDVLEVACTVDDVPVILLDTAGERVTADPIEAAGLALARELVAEADLLVVVLRARPEGIDATELAILERTAGLPRVVVYNGVDGDGVAPCPEGAWPAVAPRGSGLAEVRRAIRDALVGREVRSDGLMIASARQRDRLLALAASVDEAAEALPAAGVAVAVEALYRSLAEIDATTGADTREDVLDALFARFCIGK